MQYDRESLRDIRSRILRSLDVAECPYSYKGILGTALAGMVHMLHGHIDFLAKNMLPDTVYGDVLDSWARVWGVTRNPAIGPTVTLFVQGTPGKTVPHEWVVNGFDFTTDEDINISLDGKAEVLCRSKFEPTGFDSINKATLKIANAEIETDAEITKRSKAVEAETNESLRKRLYLAIQMTAQGGSYLDYIRWVESIPGVKQAWVRPWHMMPERKPGYVGVTWLEADLKQSQTTKEQIENHLQRLAPGHASVSVDILKEKMIDLKIRPVPNSQDCRDAIKLAVHNFFNDESKPGFYLDRNYQKTTSFISKSRLTAAISAITLEQSHEITNLPGDIPVGEGEITRCQIKFI